MPFAGAYVPPKRSAAAVEGIDDDAEFTQHIADDINNCGHNVVQTVFAQCNAMYKTDGPEELKCVGETEFVQVRPLDDSIQFTPCPA